MGTQNSLVLRSPTRPCIISLMLQTIRPQRVHDRVSQVPRWEHRAIATGRGVCRAKWRYQQINPERRTMIEEMQIYLPSEELKEESRLTVKNGKLTVKEGNLRNQES